MKSIYEASVAYGREHQGTVNIEDFEAGANYVLEEIEHYLNNPKEEFIKMFPNSPLGASHATLKQVIKELKGE